MAMKTQVYLYKDNPQACWKEQGGINKDDDYIHVIQGEAGSEVFYFHLFLSQSAALDLTGKIVTFYFTKPDGNKIFLPADVPAETAADGIAVVTLTAQSTAASGLTKYGEIRITTDDERVLKFQVPDIYISGSNTEGAVESTSEFHALDAALSNIQPYLTSMEKALCTMQDTLNQINAAAEKAEENAALALQKAQSAVSAQESAAQSKTSAKSSANLAHQDAQSASASAAASSSTALTVINKQKGQTNGIASLGGDGKISERIAYSHLDALPSAFPPQSHTHLYSDLTGASPFISIFRTHVSSLQQITVEGHYLIYGTAAAGTPTNDNAWVIDAKQEGWGMIAMAYGVYDTSVYITNRYTPDNGKSFYWNAWKKIV